MRSPCQWVLLIFLALHAVAGVDIPRKEPRPRLVKRGTRAWNHERSAENLVQVGSLRTVVHAVSDQTHRAYSTAVRLFLYDAGAHEVDSFRLRYLDGVCYIKGMGFQKAWADIAVALISYDAFLREGDWEMVAGRDVIRPGLPPHVAFRLGLGARGLSRKTRVENEMAAHLMKELDGISNPSAPFFPLEQAAFRRAWWEAMKPASDVIGLQLLRYSGPSLRAQRG